MARKKLNKNLVVVLTLFAFAAIVVLSVLMLRSLQKGDPQHFVDLAVKHEEKGEWRQAALFYGKAWEKSRNWEYLVLRGDMLLNEGEVGMALRDWREVLVNSPDMVQAHLRQLEILLELAQQSGQMRSWTAVQEAAEPLLELETAQKHQAFAHYALGLALMGLESQAADNAERGMHELHEAVRLAPEDVEYAIDLATYQAQRGKQDAGEQLFEELLQRHAEPGAAASKVRTAYAKYLAGQGRSADAERYLNEGVSFAQGESEVLLEARMALADYLARQWATTKTGERTGDSELLRRAEELLMQCVEENPDEFGPSVRLALLYKASQRPERVVEVCDQRLTLGFSRKGLKSGQNKLDAFRLMIMGSEASVAMAQDPEVSQDEGRRAEWLARAESYVAQAGSEFVDHPKVLSQSGRIKLARGGDRDALDDFRRADELYQAAGVVDWENKLRLANLHLDLNEAGAARAVLEEALNQAGDRVVLSCWILYARVLLHNAQRGEPIDAQTAGKVERALAVIASVDPDRPELRQLQAVFLELQGKPGQAGMLTESPTARALLEARERVIQGDTDGAVALLQEALVDAPADNRLVTAAVRDLLRLGRAGEAEAVAKRALELKPDDAQLRKLAVFASEEMSPEDRDAALLDIINSEEDAFQRSWDLIDYYWRREDPAAALRYFAEAEQHLIEKDTEQARKSTIAQHRALLKAKLFVAKQADDAEAMAAARDSAVKYNVDGAEGKSLVGLYHMYRDEVEPAIVALAAAVEAQPTDARSLTYLAQCYQNVERLDAARDLFERATRMNPNEALAHKGLAAIAKQQGEERSYRRHLAICEGLIPGDPWVQGEVLARKEQDNPEQAIIDREALLATDPDNVANLARLAALAETLGDQAKADGYYQRILDIRGDEQGVVALVSKYFVRTGRPESSLEVVNEYVDSKTTADEKADARILIAAHYLGLQELDLAETALLEAADVSRTLAVCHSLGDFNLRTLHRPSEALRWYEQAAELARQQSSPKLSKILGARIICVMHREVDDLDAAQTYVDEFLAEFPDDPQGALWEGELHARRGQIDQAIDAFSRYLEARPNEPYALFQRAQHYGAMGRTAEAIQDLEAIKRVDPTALRLEPRILLARMHRQAGMTDAWLSELESIVADAPDSAPALEELISALIDEGRLVDADRRVTTEINRSGDETDSRWLFLRGRISRDLGKAPEALRDFRRGAELAGYTPEALANVLGLYMQLGQNAEAVRYYDQHAGNTEQTPGLQSHYARALAGAGQMPEAVREFRRAMGLAEAVSVQAVAAVAADIRSAFPGADGLQRAIALFEADVLDGRVARMNRRILARLYEADGRTEASAAELDRLLSTATEDKERVSLLIELAELQQNAGDTARAVELYEDVLRYSSDNWIVLNNIAYLLADELGQTERALPYARRAVAIADRPNTLDTLGWIYVGLGQYPRAVAELSRAVRLAPSDALAHYHLGEAYRRNRQFIEASSVLERGRETAQSIGDTALIELIDTAADRAARGDGDV